jgi:uncharacterized protein YbjT (DUF2867 family)
MDERPGTILVAGATGNQGGTALRHLLREGWKVRALTRNPESRAARELSDLGAELVRADFNDQASLKPAFAGVYGVFLPSVQVNLRVPPETEIRHGSALVEAAKEAGVRHLVYASEMGANENAELEFLASKGKIESLIRRLALPATILRHAFFIEWLAGSFEPIVWRGLKKGLGHDRSIQVVALDDIGAFTALVFSDPERFIGREIEIAGDDVSRDEISQAYQRVRGAEPKATLLPYWVITRIGQFGKFIRHLPAQESRADIPSLRALQPDLKDFEDGLRAARPMPAPSGGK